MKELGVVEHQEKCRELLKYFDSVCRDNNINYSMCGGSLLGTIRHQGFIPWDDDIDVCLIRDQYDKLISILSETSSDYYLQNHNKNNTVHPFAKLVDKRTSLKSTLFFSADSVGGVYIDIFPIDNMPCDEHKAINFKEECQLDYKKYHRSIFPNYASNYNLVKAVIKLLLLFPLFVYLRLSISPKNRLNNLVSKMKKFNSEDTGCKGYVLSRYVEKECYPSYIFDSYTDATFEGLKVKIMCDYDVYLQKLYGDYMIVPPKEKRVQHSEYVFFSDEN